MRALTEETLRRALLWTEKQYHPLIQWFIDHGLEDINQWLPIENAPKDREILVYAPPHDGLGALKQICKWHESAGFCIDEFRTVTHYQELPEDIK